MEGSIEAVVEDAAMEATRQRDAGFCGGIRVRRKDLRKQLDVDCMRTKPR